MTADPKTILERVIQKRANHFTDVHENQEYTLLYPDNSKIVHLPETTKPFILNKYKEDLRRNYNRITIFIATKVDYLYLQIYELDEHLKAESPDNHLSSVYDNERTIKDTGDNPHCRKNDRSLKQSQTKWKQTTLTTFDKVNEPDPNTKNDTDSDEQKDSFVEHYIECPTCFESFPVHKIAEHAD